ncbi:MAG: DUF721 domain-containing protein [Nitrospirota bacterium]|nr:DUF721 domain-containing protein [Nitrospirota bacterium]
MATGKRSKASRRARTGPQAVGGLLPELARAGGWSVLLDAVRLRAEWRSLVGDMVADHTEPERLGDGRLLVRVDNAAWLAQLSFFRRDIATKVNAWFGHRRVEEVVLLVGRMTPAAAPAARASAPVSAEERREVEDLVGKLDDPQVRDAMRALLLRDLRQGRRSQQP